MLLKKVISILSARKHATIFDIADSSVQWVSDGFSAYPLDDFPTIDENSFFIMASVPEKNKGNWCVARRGADAAIDFSDDNSGNAEYPADKIRMLIDGYLPLRYSTGIVFIDPQYLKPIEDEGGYELFIRYNNDGERYIAVKVGERLRALITPKACISEDFVDNLEVIYALSKREFDKENS